VLVPDAVEPVVGWRSWRVVDSPDGLVLVSACRPTRWPPRRPAQGSCETRGHAEPPPDCTCGIYAAAQPLLPVTYLPPHVKATETIRTQAILGYDVVMGVGLAALWGVVVECPFGWRAQYGYPRALCVPRGIRHFRRRGRVVDVLGSERIAGELAELYGIPVHVAASLHPARLAESLAA
jgi:hypothetical protein